MDSNLDRELSLGKAIRGQKDLVHRSLAAEEAFQTLSHTVEVKEQIEIALSDIEYGQAPMQLAGPVIVLEFACYLAVDGGIYMLPQTYTALF